MPNALSRTFETIDAACSSLAAPATRRGISWPTIPLAYLAAHIAEAGAWIAVWQLASQASLAGQLNTGWLWAWTLLLTLLVPLRACSAWSVDWVSMGLTKRSGFSHPLFASGPDSLLSLVELGLASAVLTICGDNGLLFSVFLAWAILAIGAGCRYACECDRWTSARLAITHRRIEEVTGHRTRLEAESSKSMYLAEDDVLGLYQDTSERMNRWTRRLASFGPRGWLVAGALCLIPALNGSISPARMAIEAGGVILAYQALRGALGGVSKVICDAVTWRGAAALTRWSEEIETVAKVQPVAVPVRSTPAPSSLLSVANLRTQQVLSAMMLLD